MPICPGTLGGAGRMDYIYAMRKGVYFVIALFTVVAACQSSSSSPLLSEQEFCRVFCDSLNHRFPAVKFRVINEHTIIGELHGKEVTLFADNAYEAYRKDKYTLVPTLQRYLNSYGEDHGREIALQADNVVPVVRGVQELQQLKVYIARQKIKDSVINMLHENYNEDLSICYAIDTKYSVSYLAEKDFDSLGIARDSLRTVAIRNLRSRLDIKREGADGVYLLVADGNYESSLILLPELWKKEELLVDGDFVVAVPCRDVLLITGSRNKDGIKKLNELASKYYEENSYFISKKLFRWDGKKFIRLEE